MGHLQSKKNAATRAMGDRCVFQPFPHHHCEFASPGKKWRMLAAHDPRTRSVGLLRSLLRALNGTKMRVQVLC
jgi:hypothetical protein